MVTLVKKADEFSFSERPLYKPAISLDSTPLILLHGLFGNLSNWNKTVNFFSDNYKVMVPELPVYQNAWSSNRLGLFVDYLHEEFIAKNHIDNAVLVGNSMGGHVAILYALKYPERVQKLVLVGSAGLFEDSHGVSFPKIKSKQFIEDRVSYTFFNKEVVTQSLVDEVFTCINDPGKSLNLMRVARSVTQNDVSERLHELKVPTLLIWGREDRITPLHVAFRFKRLIGENATLKVIDRCGHAPMMERPELFNQILSDFISNQEVLN